MSSLTPAITDLDQLKDRYAVAKLLEWNKSAVHSAKFDRDELSIYVDRSSIREACEVLKPDFHFFFDLTCVDWAPNEPRFHLAYHLLLHSRRERVRLKVAVPGDDAVVGSIFFGLPAVGFFQPQIFVL